MMFQLINTGYMHMTHQVLKIAPNSVIYWVHVGVLGGQRLGEINSGVA